MEHRGLPMNVNSPARDSFLFGLLVALCFALVVVIPVVAARAQLPLVEWSLETMPPTYFHAMAYDSDRRVTVLFGGFNGSAVNGETWEWNGTVWSRREVSGPSPRGGHAMAYDSVRHVTVLFGGAFVTPEGVVPLNDTWEWNGTVWTQRIVAGPKPSPRASHTVVYDSLRQRTVLFGGYDDSSGIDNGETWEWNGAGAGAWTQRTVTGPSPRGGHRMVYDAGAGVAVLFGGWINGGSTNSSETWEWNGAGAGSWTHRSATGPSPRRAHAMAYDSARGVTVLFGGNLGTSQNVQPSGETWEWNGAGGGNWTPVIGGGPLPRQSHAMVYDAFRQKTVVFGGDNGGSCNGETWERETTGWTLRASSGPSPRVEGSAMAFDVDRSVAVLFGGASLPASYQADTWEWNGARWTQRMVAGPSGRYNHAMAYDAARHATVLFGGQVNANGNAGSVSGETWLWNGSVWTLWVGAGPSAREGHRMVYDAGRSVVVLFGGWNPNGTVNGETWEWNGAGSGTWAVRSTSGPAPRAQHDMAYDALHGVTVLFGGNVHDSTGGPPTSSNDETWTWNGAGVGTWSRRFVSGPSPRQDHAMAYDADRNLMVLYGGYDGITGLCNDQTWEWNGSAWARRMIGGPPPLAGPGITYDATRRKTILFGGFGGSTTNPIVFGETWGLGAYCPSDLDNDGDFANGGTRDDAVDINDMLYFLVAFEAGHASVDLDNDGDPVAGTPDGAVTIDDLLFFLIHFEDGC
jgi:hypothetical protein